VPSWPRAAAAAPGTHAACRRCSHAWSAGTDSKAQGTVHKRV
jgi:hypothetical protein